MKRERFNIPNITDSLRRDYLAGIITASEVARELHRAHLTPYRLDDTEALERIGLSPKKP